MMTNEKFAKIAGLEKDTFPGYQMKDPYYLKDNKQYCLVSDFLPRQKVEQAIAVWIGFKNDFPLNYEPHILGAIASSLMTLNSPEELADAICTAIEEAEKCGD